MLLGIKSAKIGDPSNNLADFSPKYTILILWSFMDNVILSVSHLVKEFDKEPKNTWDGLTRHFFDFIGSKKIEKMRAVNDISFDVHEGEILGLLGPNGAGKTTTIHMLLGLIKQTSGEIAIFEQNFLTNRESILSQMNFSSAYSELPYQLTIYENLYFSGELYGVMNLKHRVETVLDVFELTEIKKRSFSDLSAGQKARLNLAKCFINRPRLVLLDEPTASLDPDIANKVRSFILSSRDKFNTSVLFTSHNMSEVEEICDRVVFINKGKIVDIDTPENLAKKIKTVRVSLLVKDGKKRILKFAQENSWPVSDEERFITIELNDEEVAWFLAGLTEKGIEYSDISIDKPTLEDYFLQQTRGEKYEVA